MIDIICIACRMFTSPAAFSAACPSCKNIILTVVDNYCLQDQVSLLDGFYYVSHFSDEDVSSCEVCPELKTWIFSIKEYSLGITAKRKSGLGISQSEESFLTGKCISCLIKLTCIMGCI